MRVKNNNNTKGETLKFDFLDNFNLLYIDLEFTKVSSLVQKSIEKLLAELVEFKEQARIHENLIQIQTQKKPKKGAFEMQANKVIVEQTYESSEEEGDESELEKSLAIDDLTLLLAEFTSAQSQAKEEKVVVI